MTEVETRPARSEDLADLAALFEASRNTRRCWCMALCTSRRQFATGWLTGGNRRRFESMATEGAPPMGVLASVAGEPVGWGACGPRARYTTSIEGRGRLLRDQDRGEDDVVWLLPCLFVPTPWQGKGITYALVRAAAELARSVGAEAIEGWPLTGSDPVSADAFYGRERVFEAAGFRRVAAPEPHRSIMRLELDGAPPSSA